ncbi:MOSC N-terminal beta barrel domain-containing protein [Kitasatospora sp. NPDC097643]|uniref:MOSC domain-containing protein n=1 Tax=Kitasatospora sp. NPDC097643 TaxID=3157230 RepID=UPI0033181DAB
MSVIATVQRLRRYPVKSLLGEDLREAEVDRGGLERDRARALLDLDTGKVASAKNPRLWAGLLDCAATATADGGVAVTGPDGRCIDEAGLSELLGRKVSLIAERPPGASIDRSVPEQVLAHGIEAEVEGTVVELGRGTPGGSFVDFAPLHLLTTSSLAAAGAESEVEAERYRPNLVLRTEGEGFVENDWVGRELTIGATLRLNVLVPTPRCAVPTLRHGPLPRRADALRIPAERNRVVPMAGLPALPCVGVYAQVLVPGRIRVGDEVRLD